MQLRTLGRRAAAASASVIAVAGLSFALAGAASASTAKPHFPIFLPNKITLTVTGGGVFKYPVHLTETPVGPWWAHEDEITGTLTDNYEPVSPLVLPVSGFQNGATVVIWVNYPTTGPDAGPQGQRFFAGTLPSQWVRGPVTGNMTELGPEGLTGAFVMNRV